MVLDLGMLSPCRASRSVVPSKLTSATAIVLAALALLVGIAFAAKDKCRADVCFRQHHALAS
jgi:hypothetical protein